MDTVKILLIAVFSALLASIVIGMLIPYLQSKGIPIGSGITKAKTVVQLLQGVLKQIIPLLPGNSNLDLAEKILQYAEVGVQQAEQLYLSSQLAEDSRKASARNYVETVLLAGGIEITDDIRTIIDGAIEAAVILLPPTHEQKK